MADSNNLVQVTLRGKDELTVTLKQVKEAFAQFEKDQLAASQRMRETATQHAKAWKQAASVLGGLGIATGIAGITAATVAFGKSVVDTGVKIEGLRASLTATSGSVQAGARTFQFLIDTSNRLGTDLLTSANAFKSLQAATRGTAVEGQQTQQLFTAISGAIKVTGGSSEQLGRALIALQQIVSKGTVSSEELRGQLGEALPGAFQIAARAMGVTTAELSKMLEQGKLLSTDFIVPFTRQLEQEFTPAVDAASKTVGSAFARLGNEITLAKNAIAESGLLGTLVSLADAATSFLKASRELAEFRAELAGGPPLVLPPELAQSAEGRRVTEEMAQYRAQITGRRGLLENLVMPTREQAAERLKVLLDDQKRLIAEHNARLNAENDDLKNPFRVMGDAAEQRQKAEAAMQKLFAGGLKDLERIQLNAPFLSSLELAEEKLKSWDKTLKSIREEFDKLDTKARQQAGGAVSSRWGGMIGPIAAERGVSPALVAALIQQESGGDPRAVSSAGAKGLGQFMPDTAAQYRIAGREFEPEANIRATVNYLADLLKQFGGDIHKALTAYNAGPRNGGIPYRTGENATFADQVLRRIPGGMAGLTSGQALSQQGRLQADVEAFKDDAQRRQQAMDAGREYTTHLEEQHRKQEAALVSLQRLAAGYTQTKEARDADTASLLAAQFPQDAAIQAMAAQVTALATTREAYKAETEALNERFIALKQTADAQRESEQAQEDFNKRLADTLALLQVPREQRTSERLRQQAPGGVSTPSQEMMYGAIDAEEKAQRQAKAIEDINQHLARNIHDIFSTMWDGVTSGGVKSFQQFGLLVAQSLQRTLAQVSSLILNQLLNQAANTQDSKGGWAGALAGIATKFLGGLLGGGAGADAPGSDLAPSSGAIDWSGVAEFANGGIVQGLRSIRDAGFRQRALFRGFQPLAMATGGIVRQPSLAMIGEGGQNEAVVPLPDGRSIPVSMTPGMQASKAAQPVVIEMHTSFIDPATQKTTRQEVRSWVIEDVANDSAMRRVIQQYTR